MFKSIVECDDPNCENFVEFPNVKLIPNVPAVGWVYVQVVFTSDVAVEGVQVCSMGHLTTGVEYRLSLIQGTAP